MNKQNEVDHVVCSSCDRVYAVNRDGTVRTHGKCAGSGTPMAQHGYVLHDASIEGELIELEIDVSDFCGNAAEEWSAKLDAAGVPNDRIGVLIANERAARDARPDVITAPFAPSVVADYSEPASRSYHGVVSTLAMAVIVMIAFFAAGWRL